MVGIPVEIRQQQVWEQLAIGGVDFARVSLSAATDNLPRLNVLLLPYLSLIHIYLIPRPAKNII